MTEVKTTDIVDYSKVIYLNENEVTMSVIFKKLLEKYNIPLPSGIFPSTPATRSICLVINSLSFTVLKPKKKCLSENSVSSISRKRANRVIKKIETKLKKCNYDTDFILIKFYDDHEDPYRLPLNHFPITKEWVKQMIQIIAEAGKKVKVIVENKNDNDVKDNDVKDNNTCNVDDANISTTMNRTKITNEVNQNADTNKDINDNDTDDDYIQTGSDSESDVDADVDLFR